MKTIVLAYTGGGEGGIAIYTSSKSTVDPFSLVQLEKLWMYLWQTEDKILKKELYCKDYDIICRKWFHRFCSFLFFKLCIVPKESPIDVKV